MTMGRDGLPSPALQRSTSPLLARQRAGNERDRPMSWPPLVVVEGEDAKAEMKRSRTTSGGYGRNARLDGHEGGVSGGGGDNYRSNGLTLESSAFPSVPRTIMEEDEEDDSSDLEFY